jgi:hypothetical protein
MVKNFITAENARKQSEASEKPLNVLFKHIQEASEWGLCKVNFDVLGWSTSRITETKNFLIEAGYSVTEMTDELGATFGLDIQW